MKINTEGINFIPKTAKSDRSENEPGPVTDKPELASKVSKTNGSDSVPAEMNTQDFISLHTIRENDSFKILDDVIDTLKENLKESGDAIEAIAEMVKKTSKENVSLQILEKTLEALRETESNER